MRFIAVFVLAACGGSAPKPTPADRAPSDTTAEAAATSSSGQAPAAPTKPIKFPAPPEGPAPTGTWRVTLEFPRLLGRPSGIVADASGVYLAGAVLSADDVRMRRWALVKLDAAGAIKWSNVTELPRSPAPDRIVVSDGAVVVAGEDGSHEATRMLLIERRDAASGKKTWQRRFTARDPKCVTVACASKDTLGGIAVRGTTVLYSATVDRPIEEAFGELSLAKGEPSKTTYQTRSDLRAHDIAADEGGMYLLEDTLSNLVSLVKLADGKQAWIQKVPSGAMRIAAMPAGLLLWAKTIEKRAPDTGELAWTSKLAGDHIDVASDATGIYATVMIDAKPAPYFAIAKLDPANGAVQWLRKTSEYSENRPSAHIAVDKDAIYLLGYDAEKMFVERRRKSDGALGEVATTARTVETPRK